MKKILVFLLLLCLTSYTVRAQTFYSAYGDWQETSNMVDNTELQEGKVEYKYKFYQERQNFTEDYYGLLENPLDYPYKSLEKKVMDFSLWSIEKPEEQEDRVIEEKTVYPYQILQQINSLTIFDALGSGGKLWITEIEVLYKNEKIPFNISCEGCSNIKLEWFNDNDTKQDDTKLSYLYPSDKLRLDLLQKYDLKDLAINVYIADPLDSGDSNFTVTVNDYVNNDYYVMAKRAYWIHSSPGDVFIDRIKLLDYMVNPHWEDTIYESDEEVSKSIDVYPLEPVTYYRYQDTKYLYYQMVRDYTDNYFFSYLDNWVRDDENKISVYYQRSREKIIVNDDIHITKNYLDVDDIITYSTVPISNLMIRNNINWNVPGQYMIEILYSGLHVRIPIIYDYALEEVNGVKEDTNNKESTQKPKVVPIANKNDISVSTSQSKLNSKQIVWFLILLLGIILMVYSLKKIVDRKKS